MKEPLPESWHPTEAVQSTLEFLDTAYFVCGYGSELFTRRLEDSQNLVGCPRRLFSLNGIGMRPYGSKLCNRNTMSKPSIRLDIAA